jgi:hypothetical protein
VVKFQRDGKDLLAITFNIGRGGMLIFSHTNIFNELAALNYLDRMGCELIDGYISTVNN